MEAASSNVFYGKVAFFFVFFLTNKPLKQNCSTELSQIYSGAQRTIQMHISFQKSDSQTVVGSNYVMPQMKSSFMFRFHPITRTSLCSISFPLSALICCSSVKESSFHMKLLTTRFMIYLEQHGHDF